MFELYLEGKSFATIAMILTSEGWLDEYNECNWTRHRIDYTLKNIKYKGCAISQVTVTNDGVTLRNKGLAKQYYMAKTHEPIIEPDVFDKVQELIKKKASECKPKQFRKSLYPFTGLIECGCCHNNYNHKINNTNKPWRSEVWVCRTKNENNVCHCPNSPIKDSVLKDLFVEAYNEFITIKPKNDIEKDLQNDLQDLLEQESELNKLGANHLINMDDYKESKEEIKNDIEKIINKLSAQKISGVKEKDFTPIDEFNEEKVYKFIDKIVINHYQITFRFNNGVEMTKPYTNGKSGNKKGWKTKQLEVK